MQVIRLLEKAFKATGLPAYLCSYGCLPTGYERGIIEVVPHTKSRYVQGSVECVYNVEALGLAPPTWGWIWSVYNVEALGLAPPTWGWIWSV